MFLKKNYFNISNGSSFCKETIRMKTRPLQIYYIRERKNAYPDENSTRLSNLII